MKKIIILLCGILFSTYSFSQRSEIGGLIGTSYYLGDINTSSQFYKPNIAGGLIYRYNLTPHWALKFNALYGTLEAYDIDFGEIRNLSFKSHIMEFSAQFELNFFQYFTGSKKHRFSPYIFGGVALFNFNPEAYYFNPTTLEGKWYDLQPLGTEGQGTVTRSSAKPYSLTQFAIPFGLGVKFSLSKSICLGAEWGLRKTFTDYIDDISTTYMDHAALSAEKGQIAAALADRTPELIDPDTNLPRIPNEDGMSRGNSETTDWYSFAGLTITFKLGYKSKPSCFDKGFNYKDNIYY
jgi:hypothetical protein